MNNTAPIRIVLTGSPSSGKTSLLQQLQSAGHSCFEEVSREIIQESIHAKTDITPWQNLQAFSKKVFDHRVQQYHNAMPGLNFYDRSLIDVIAYLSIGNNTNSDIIDAVKDYPYDLVFIARPWKAIFVNDAQRLESWEDALIVDKALEISYKKLGYHIVDLPESSVAERVDFIDHYIKKHL
jgi:predicted ATPase